MSTRPTILVELGHFRRSFRANGPNRSFVRAAAALSDRFRFRVISLAEAGDTIGKWDELDGMERIAVAQGRLFATGLGNLIRDTPHALVVCNGLFNRPLTLATLLMKRTGRIPGPVLLAPRGEFSPGALDLKSLRKAAYLRFLKASGLLNGISLQATDDAEAERITAHLPDTTVLIGPNVRTIDPLPDHQPRAPGTPLRIVFLSRIDRMKNLDWALDLLAQSPVPLRFDIFGPVTDPAYWTECRERIARLPDHITVHLGGEVDPDTVPALLARYDLFLLPTRGENFGHAIADALLAGTPVLVADTTPWRGLAQTGAGADLPLDQPGAWLSVLAASAHQSPPEAQAARAAARHFAEQRLGGTSDVDRLAACFDAAIAHI